MGDETRPPRPAPLIRPSALARFWALHPKTVIDWIHAGALVAIRSPGSQYRLRPTDVRDFCARQSLTVPPFAQTDQTRIVLAGVSAGGRRTIERALADKSVVLIACSSALEGIVAAVREPPAVVALDGASPEVDIDAALRALRGVPGMEAAIVIVFDAPSDARAADHLRAGASHALVKGAKGARAPWAKVLADHVPD